MKQFLTFVLFVLLSATQAQAQTVQDTVYFWKTGSVVLKQSIKTADLDSITFKRGAIVTPTPQATVTIGNQVWTTKNLDVATYSDGTVIPQVTDPTQWQNLKTGAWCYYNNDAANGTTYGKLYNWYAVAGIHDTNPNTPNKILAPVGYHIPTEAEWTTLTTSLGGESIAGGKMKTTGTTLWLSPNTGATNSSGFTGLPGGSRSNGIFYDRGGKGFWWSASEDGTTLAWYRGLYYGYDSTYRSNNDKQSGISVRCLAGEAVVALAPTITTTTATAIATINATSGGNITNDGGAAVTARGVVYSTTTNPTIALTTKTTDGTGTGTFVSNITGLTANTTYYVRAYATNSAGTSYGDEVSFTTTATTTNPLGITTAAIPAGTFMMGSPTTEVNRSSDEVQHSVTLSAFSMSIHEITCEQYAQFLNANSIESNGLWAAGQHPTQKLCHVNSSDGLIYSGGNWVAVTGKANAPMVNITWFGAAAFAQFAGGRLPTEAEWEYAARATTTTAFNTGACLSNTQANYYWGAPQTGCSNSNTSYLGTTQTVGTYAANAWGLYDMHGNVLEWCSDWYDTYPNAAVTNPTGPTTGSFCVLRGGGLGSGAPTCRSAQRDSQFPTNSGGTGFRVVF